MKITSTSRQQIQQTETETQKTRTTSGGPQKAKSQAQNQDTVEARSNRTSLDQFMDSRASSQGEVQSQSKQELTDMLSKRRSEQQSTDIDKIRRQRDTNKAEQLGGRGSGESRSGTGSSFRGTEGKLSQFHASRMGTSQGFVPSLLSAEDIRNGTFPENSGKAARPETSAIDSLENGFKPGDFSSNQPTRNLKDARNNLMDGAETEPKTPETEPKQESLKEKAVAAAKAVWEWARDVTLNAPKNPVASNAGTVAGMANSVLSANTDSPESKGNEFLGWATFLNMRDGKYFDRQIDKNGGDLEDPGPDYIPKGDPILEQMHKDIMNSVKPPDPGPGNVDPVRTGETTEAGRSRTPTLGDPPDDFAPIYGEISGDLQAGGNIKGNIDYGPDSDRPIEGEQRTERSETITAERQDETVDPNKVL